MVHVPGKWTGGPDALSRQKASVLSIFHDPSHPEDNSCDVAHTALAIASIYALNEIRSVTLDDVRKVAR